jgi:hypothetical protein
MKQKPLRVVVTTLAVLSLAATAWAEKVRVTGCFTNMHWVADAGDVLGMEVRILYSLNPDGVSGDYWVLFQDAQGAPAAPVLVKATVTGQTLEFAVPASSGAEGTFKGVVTETALEGMFSGVQNPIRLPRGKSYWE